MMRKIRVGERYAFSRHKYKPKRLYRYISLLAVLTSMCLYARAQEDIEWTPAASGQSAAVEKGLQVGDTVPDLFIPKILRYHKTSAHLSDYRGKVLILDFWSTYCSVCLYSMPRLHAIQQEFERKVEVLPVTFQSQETIERFFTDYQGRFDFSELRNLAFPSVVADTVLRGLFPSVSLPHIVVLDGDGVVKAITTAEYLTHEAIAGIIAKDTSVYIPLKRKGFEKPSLGKASDYADVKQYGSSYYQALLGFIDGISHASSFVVDSDRRHIHHFVSNTTIAKLYTATRQFDPIPLQRNRRILEVSDPERYVFNYEGYRNIDLRRKNYRSYEAVLPFGTTEMVARKRMRESLDLLLNLRSHVEKRIVPCLVLKTLAGFLPTDSLENVQKIATTQLVRELNYDQLNLPPVVDGTRISEAYKLPLKNGLRHYARESGLEGVILLLNRYGLTLEPAERELEMFVLTEPDFKGTNKLKLTTYGFVPVNQ